MLMRLFSSSDKHSLQKICSQHLIQINLVVDLRTTIDMSNQKKVIERLIKDNVKLHEDLKVLRIV